MKAERSLIILFLFLPLSLFGQDSVQMSAGQPSPVLKFSILSLLDPVSSIQFAYEYPLNQQSVLQHEAGYVTRLFYNENGDKNLRGFRTRHEYRYYFRENKASLQGWYWAPELMYTHLWFERDGRDPSVYLTQEVMDKNGGKYPDFPDYPVQKVIFAVHPARAGYQKSYNRFVLDMYGGVGYRHVRVNAPDHIIEDLYEVVSMRKEAGVYNLWSLSLGIKLGYKL